MGKGGGGTNHEMEHVIKCVLQALINGLAQSRGTPYNLTTREILFNILGIDGRFGLSEEQRRYIADTVAIILRRKQTILGLPSFALYNQFKCDRDLIKVELKGLTGYDWFHVRIVVDDKEIRKFVRGIMGDAEKKKCGHCNFYGGASSKGAWYDDEDGGTEGRLRRIYTKPPAGGESLYQFIEGGVRAKRAAREADPDYDSAQEEEDEEKNVNDLFEEEIDKIEGLLRKEEQDLATEVTKRAQVICEEYNKLVADEFGEMLGGMCCAASILIMNTSMKSFVDADPDGHFTTQVAEDKKSALHSGIDYLSCLALKYFQDIQENEGLEKLATIYNDKIAEAPAEHRNQATEFYLGEISPTPPGGGGSSSTIAGGASPAQGGVPGGVPAADYIQRAFSSVVTLLEENITDEMLEMILNPFNWEANSLRAEEMDYDRNEELLIVHLQKVLLNKSNKEWEQCLSSGDILTCVNEEVEGDAGDDRIIVAEGHPKKDDDEVRRAVLMGMDDDALREEAEKLGKTTLMDDLDDAKEDLDWPAFQEKWVELILDDPGITFHYSITGVIKDIVGIPSAKNPVNSIYGDLAVAIAHAAEMEEDAPDEPGERVAAAPDAGSSPIPAPNIVAAKAEPEGAAAARRARRRKKNKPKRSFPRRRKLKRSGPRRKPRSRTRKKPRRKSRSKSKRKQPKKKSMKERIRKTLNRWLQ